jgi:hypothetical protein
MIKELTIDELKQSSPAFCNALLYAGHLSTDELFAVFDQLKYKAFGFPAVMLFKMEHNNHWEAGLRNDVNWEEPKIDCKGKTAKDAMVLMYALCVHKGYLPCVQRSADLRWEGLLKTNLST